VVRGVQRRRGSGGEAGVEQPIRIRCAVAEGIIGAARRAAENPDLNAELKSVFASHPGNVVGEIVDGTLKRRGVRNALIESQKIVPSLVGITEGAEALADKA